MKKLIVALLVALSVTAVSCEQAEEVVVPVFPQAQQLTFTTENNTQQLTFEANTDWTLVSPVVWCKFIDQKGVESNSIHGEAGTVTVQVKVSGEGQLVGEEGLSDKTQIQIIMKNQKQTLAEVVRNANGFLLELLDENGAAVPADKQILEVGYKEYVPFRVKANFSFLVTQKPDWVEIDGGTLIGAVGQVVTGKLKIAGDGKMEKYPIAPSGENVITFADKEGKVSYDFQVNYAGMPAGEIEIHREGSRPDWTVSMDGTTFTQEGANAGLQVGTIEFPNQLPATVKTLNDQFDLFFIEEADNMYFSNLDGDFEHPADWMEVTNDKGKLTISVGETSEDRHGWVLALPEGAGITAENWFEKFLVTEMDPEMGTMNQSLNLDAIEPYLVAELIQAEPKEEGSAEGMVVTQDGIPVELEVITGDWPNTEYGVSEVYCYKMQSSPISLTIDPMLSGEYEVMAFKGDEDLTDAIDFSSGLPNLWFEGTLMPGERIEVLFKQNWMNARVLIIEPAE